LLVENSPAGGFIFAAREALPTARLHAAR
jgi:hypothetical protein